MPPASFPTRQAGQSAVRGVPTLCDELHGWRYECAVSNSSICYAQFGIGPRRSCDDWCGDAGLVCIAGADDTPKVCKLLLVAMYA